MTDKIILKITYIQDEKGNYTAFLKEYPFYCGTGDTLEKAFNDLESRVSFRLMHERHFGDLLAELHPGGHPCK